ncbi:MAG: N-acetyltransferase family protein [Haloarculaceae archaeon]
MIRSFPDEPIEPKESPPLSFEDREGREITVDNYDDDFEDVVGMYLDFEPADRAQGIPPTGEADIRSWLDHILVDDAINVVARHQHRVIGHAVLVPDRSDAYELAIFVLNAYQGAGIGTQLMEALLGRGQDEGIEYVWLTVERWNQAAIRLYKKMGFEESDPEGFELEMTACLLRSPD